MCGTDGQVSDPAQPRSLRIALLPHLWLQARLGSEVWGGRALPAFHPGTGRTFKAHPPPRFQQHIEHTQVKYVPRGSEQGH